MCQIAGDDFDDTPFSVTLSSSDAINTSVIILDPITEMTASIIIVDDSIDEADEEVFIVFMEVVAAINYDMIDTTTQNTSICIIQDCKW